MNRSNRGRNALLPLQWHPPQLLWSLIAFAVGTGIFFAFLPPSILLLAIFTVALAIIVFLRHDEVTASVVIVMSVLIDWYQLVGAPLHAAIITPVVAFTLVSILFLTQSSERPWISPPYWWLWGLLLLFAAPAILRGNRLSESITYYMNIFVNALLMCFLGMQVARDFCKIRRLLSLLSAFGTLVAIHSIIFARTGIFLFETSNEVSYLASVNNFRLAGSNTSRAGSFLLNPDWNGAFLALMVFILVGLVLESSTRWAKGIYGVELLLVLLGLLFTFSLSAWIAVFAGLLLLLFMVIRGRYIWLFLGTVSLASVGSWLVFNRQVSALLQRANDPRELSLRLGAWETALRVILAYPLDGIGFGLSNYLERAEPYRVPLQYVPLAHPHNSYLEIAALAGLPVLLVFLALLGIIFWRALRVCFRGERRYRPLLGGAIISIVVFSINSLAINGWSLAPLAAIAWLILGALASPALARTAQSQLSFGKRGLMKISRFQGRSEKLVGGAEP